MNEEMREDFEEWVVEYCNKINYSMKNKATKRNGDYYALMWVDSAWIGWQASREAMKPIKLPTKMKNTESSECYYYNDAIDECKEAIEQAGYKVEP